MRAFVPPAAPRLICLAAILVSAPVVPGCGVPSTTTPSNVQVWGRVTHNGTPLQGGVVIFAFGGQLTANSAAGLIAEDGQYTVSPPPPDVPFLPGRYEIIVEPPSPQRRPKRKDPEAENDSGERELAIMAMFPVPKRFRTLETSDLWVKLEDEPNRVDIDMRD